MKKGLILIMCIYLFLPVQKINAQAGVAELVIAGVKKAVKAMDLKIQRQQNKVIWLQNAQKTLENTMSKLKLKEISEWSEKQRKLYDDYFDELRKVKNLIFSYQKVKHIIQMQLRLVEDYKYAWGLLKQDKHFNPGELAEMYRIYSGIFDESVKNLDQLLLVTNSFATQMSDGKRMELIATADQRIEINLTDMRNFNVRNFRLSLSRAKDLEEAQVVKQIYGLK